MKRFSRGTWLIGSFLVVGTLAGVAPGCSSGGSVKSGAVNPGNGKPGPTPEKVTTVLKSAKILPTAGGLVHVTSDHADVNGASLSVPAHAVSTEETLTMGLTDPPKGATAGQAPLGKTFAIIPSGLAFSDLTRVRQLPRTGGWSAS